MTEPPLRYLEADPLAFRVLNEIGIIAQLSRPYLEKSTPDGLSGAGFNVLNHLARLRGAWGPARLARAFQVTKGAMTNTLQRLEAEGYVQVREDPEDGRAKTVQITKKGLKARDATLAKLTPQIAALAGALPDGLLAELLPKLAALRAIMDAARD